MHTENVTWTKLTASKANRKNYQSKKEHTITPKMGGLNSLKLQNSTATRLVSTREAMCWDQSCHCPFGFEEYLKSVACLWNQA